MSEIVNINPIDPNTFELQEYSVDDISLITNIEVQTSFNPSIDKIEYFIYDLNQNIIYSDVNGYRGYKLIDNNLILDPEADLKNLGFDEGQYNTLYNFVSPKLASSPSFPYFISQISSDRTEVRLDTTSIPNELVISSSLELTSNIQTSTGSYYDFYLDFGDNQLAIANNILLDTSSIDNPTVLIKLYEPLPLQFDINSQVWVVTQIANSVAYNINITQIFDLVDETIKLKGPNLNISIKDQINNSTDYNNLSQLDSTNQSQGSGSLQYQLNSRLAQTGIEINTDYSDYSNFIHFSSAQTRLENFYYKLSLIEEYTYSSSLSSGTTTNNYVSSSNVIWQSKTNEIITGFDDYEYYLYYSSGSTSWPKSNTTPPYTNYLTTSNSGSNWFISQSSVAEEYDIQNNNALINSIPGYLLDDPSNSQYELFIEMIGQYFDTVFLYTQDITNKYNADNRVNYGVSKDVIADILRDMGIKIYQNNFSTNDLYSAILGFTPSGSLYNLPYTTGSLPSPAGYEYINTYITASNTGSIVPTENINTEIYKRIYSNLPYLLKKKGTTEGLKALITLYGIPDTILQVNEFGGQNKIVEDDYDLWFNEYNYAFDTEGANYVTSSFSLNSNWNSANNVPAAVEFRFKTDGLPINTGYYSQSLWSTNQGSLLILRYTGSGYTSGSYSGSIPNPYNEFALLEFIPNTSSLSTSASIYLPFFDKNWWSVLINRSGSIFTLYAGNKNYLGTDSNYVNYFSSSSLNGDDTPWTGSSTAYLGSGSLGKIFSGSFQEYRFYSENLNTSSFEDYIMYPYSIDANGINTAPDVLAFRATLGGELYTSSFSIHPKITGSWITTQSFSNNTSIFNFSQSAIFINNTEIIYPNQFPSGIKNRISNKIRQQNEVLPYSGSKETNLPTNQVLSPFISVQQEVPISGSYTPNIDYVEVAFSPQNEINNDIAGQLGYFNIGEYIGDPRLVSSSAESYPALDSLRNYYFEKYTGNYNIWDYIRLIKYFDNSLFKMIQDWVPARTSLSSGLVIKQTTLERNKYPVPQLSPSSSIAFYGSGSNWDTPFVVEDLTITGSSIEIYNITGSTGGTTPNLIPDYTLRAVTASNGQTYTAEYGTPLNPMLNLTQSWLGSTPSLSGSVPFTQSNAVEFFNGEFSGSSLVVENGELNPLNPYKTPSTQILLYNTSESLSGTPGTGTIFWTAGPLFQTEYVYVLYINKNDISNNNIDTALGNLNPGDTISFTIQYSSSNPLQNNIKAITTPILDIHQFTPTVYRIELPYNESTQINNNILINSVTGSNFANSPVILNPFINDNADYNNSDFNPIINNAIISRPNDKFYDVDFSSNAITAVNSAVIISASRGTGSATPSTVPQSNYTTLKSANPRYLGCKNTSPNFNIGNQGFPSSVESDKTYFAYFDWVGGSNYELINKSNFHIKYLIDNNRNVLTPNLTGSYYSSLTRTFNEQNPANVLFQSDLGNLSSAQGIKPVIKSGALTKAVIFSQTGSIASQALLTMSFSNTSAITDYSLNATINPTSYASSENQLLNLDLTTPITSGSTATTASISGDYAAIITTSADIDLIPKLYVDYTYTEDDRYQNGIVTLYIQRSTNNGITWSNLISSSNTVTHNSNIKKTITAPLENIISGSQYRAALSYTSNGPLPSVIVNSGNFYFTQNPLVNANVLSPFWATGSTSPNILTGSKFNSNIYGNNRQSDVSGSGYDTPYQIFNIQIGDEVRFSASENQVYQIIGVNPPTQNSNDSLYLTLDKPILTGTNLNSFLIRRYVPNPSFVIVDSLKIDSSPGFLIPEYTSQDILDNFDNIIKELTEKGLI